MSCSLWLGLCKSTSLTLAMFLCWLNGTSAEYSVCAHVCVHKCRYVQTCTYLGRSVLGLKPDFGKTKGFVPGQSQKPGCFCEILWVQLLNCLWEPAWAGQHACAVQMHLNMNLLKGRWSYHEIVSADRLRLAALGTAASDTVVMSPMPSVRPDPGDTELCWVYAFSLCNPPLHSVLFVHPILW